MTVRPAGAVQPAAATVKLWTSCRPGGRVELPAGTVSGTAGPAPAGSTLTRPPASRSGASSPAGRL